MPRPFSKSPAGFKRPGECASPFPLWKGCAPAWVSRVSCPCRRNQDRMTVRSSYRAGLAALLCTDPFHGRRGNQCGRCSFGVSESRATIGCASPIREEINFGGNAPSRFCGGIISTARRSGSPLGDVLSNPAARPHVSSRISCRPPCGTDPGQRFRPASDRRRPPRCGGIGRWRNRSAGACTHTNACGRA
jgi:hypothetical protein